MQERSEETAGGFENPELAHKPQKTAGPLPPWFSGNVEEDIQKQRDLESEDRQRARDFNKQFQFQNRSEATLRKQQTGEVIDLEAEEDQAEPTHGEVIDLGADTEFNDISQSGGFVYDPKVRMGDLAEKTKVEPLIGDEETRTNASASTADVVLSAQRTNDYNASTEDVIDEEMGSGMTENEVGNKDEDILDWSESDNEGTHALKMPAKGQDEAIDNSRSPSIDFEDVTIPYKPSSQRDDVNADTQLSPDMDKVAPAPNLLQQDSMADDLEQDEFDDFSDPEDEQLLLQLAKEAEEHARFASTLNNKSQAQNIADYETELKQLRNQQKKDRRDADEVTHIMITECQQLLRLFGLPYVTAPMEAEAQCAELVRLGLVDGIVTDDSDCFLFGGTRVYKNMFNQAKLVECYLSSDLEKVGWSRDKLVQVAHLLGSDYTEGLPGVGPVSAAEILGEFQTLDEFKEWWSGVQMDAIPKSQDSGNPVRKKLRKQSTKLFLPPTFPDTRVDIAYTNPDVDKDPEQFQWGVPDLDALRTFLMATIGWSQERTDEVLVPVIRDMNRRMDEGTQSNITAFFDGGVGIGATGGTKGNSRVEAFAPRKKAAESSKRMGSALSRMAEKVRLRRDDTTPAARETIDDDRGKPTSSSTKRLAKKGSKRKTSDPSEDDNTSDFEGPRKRAKKRGSGPKPAGGSKQKSQALS